MLVQHRTFYSFCPWASTLKNLHSPRSDPMAPLRAPSGSPDSPHAGPLTNIPGHQIFQVTNIFGLS